ncbi:MAG: class I SAM-dependent rRNA methyltransferase [Anaerolineales bacterium]
MYLKKGREKPVQHRHPWIFSGAVKQVVGNPDPGETVQILDADGSFLARASYSPTSQIRARMWSWNPEENISPDFFRSRIKRSLAYRKQIGFNFQMMRLIYAESDGLPGLITDQYGDTLVVQFLSAGSEYWKEVILEILADLTGAKTIYERSDAQVRVLEGLPQQSGTIFGPDPEPLLKLKDSGFESWVDIRNGHKTGYYLDQRENRSIVGGMCGGKSVLDCFCYSGGFSIQALKNQAGSVTMVDESRDALQLSEKNISLNKLDRENIETIQGDVFEVLRKFRDQAKKFDVIILDPPKFAPTAAYADKAARGYKDINLLAFKLLNPGGTLATFSCSGGISQDFFLRVLSGAARDAEVNARIQVSMRQSPDHSVNLSFPEGSYLKGFIIRVE